MWRFVVCMVAVLWGGPAHAGEPRVGVTDIDTLMAWMPEVAEAGEQVRQLQAQLTPSIVMKVNYRDLLLREHAERVAAGTAPMTDEEEASWRQQLQSLQAEIDKASTDADARVAARSAELLAPIQRKLQRAIDEVAAEQGYDFVINQAGDASGHPTILYVHPDVDLTEAIAKKIGIKVPERHE